MLKHSAGTGGNIGLGIKRYHPEHIECGGPGRFRDGCKNLVVSTAEISPDSSPHFVFRVPIPRVSYCSPVPQCSFRKSKFDRKDYLIAMLICDTGK